MHSEWQAAPGVGIHSPRMKSPLSRGQRPVDRAAMAGIMVV
jgi:hypothetical protein